MFEEITKHKKPDFGKLLRYGFEKTGDSYLYRTRIYNGEFELCLKIGSDGGIDTDLIECINREPYILYKTEQSGAYVGEIRRLIGLVLQDVADECYETSIFKSEQTLRMIDFVRGFYGDELEFLWEKSPDNAVWRRKDTGKWYGAVLTVKGIKIGLDTEKEVEIVDLRMKPDEAASILSRENYYPGWHMNKKSWYTLVLCGSVPDAEVKERIKHSFDLAVK